MSHNARLITFGAAAVSVLAGIACAVFVGGLTGEVLTIILVAGGLCAVILLVFLEVGLGEERDLAREEEQRRRRRLAFGPPGRTWITRRPRRPL